MFAICNVGMDNLEVSRSGDPVSREFTACRFDIVNVSPALTGRLFVEFFLSSDAVFGDFDDSKIGDITLPLLVFGINDARSVDLSSSDLRSMSRLWAEDSIGGGNWFLYARISCPGETDTEPGDNIARTGTSFRYFGTVDLGARDLVAIRPSNPGARTFSRASLAVHNYGPTLAPSPLLIQFYLSGDARFGNTDDRAIGNVTIPGFSIDEGADVTLFLDAADLESMTRLWSPSLVGDGTYFVFARISCETALDLNPNDNDTRAPSPITFSSTTRLAQFASATVTLSEPEQTAVIRVSRFGDASLPASVNYRTVNKSALAGLDYSAQSGTLAWEAGDASDKTILIPIRTDLLTERPEKFKVRLVDPTGLDLGSPRVCKVVIRDGPGTIPPAPSASGQ